MSGETMTYNVNTPEFVLPPKGQKVSYDGIEVKSNALRVTLSSKRGAINAIRSIDCTYNGEAIRISYWCKGWGKALVININDFTFKINPVLFDNSIIHSEEIINAIKNARTNIDSHISTDISTGKYLLDKGVINIPDEKLNKFISDLKEVLIQKDTVKIRDFLGDNMLYVFDLNPPYNDNTNEYYGRELHKKNSTAWGNILKAIEPGGAKENSQRGFYIFPWYEVGFDKYLGTWNDRKKQFENRLVEGHDAGAIIGENINVRSAPSTSSSIVGKLSWQTVKVDREYDNDNWVKVSTLDDLIQGFVSSKFLFAPWGTRVIMKKVDGNWKIIAIRTWD